MTKKLYVSGLTNRASEASLESLFSQAGTVASTQVITDQVTGAVQGFGFVEMSSESEAIHAISLFDGMLFEGHSIIVHEARPRIVRQPRPIPQEELDRS
ncbi:MAG: putative RNA-binding protein RbpA [Chloroflexi bacterium]|jgi:RNA recognition motif-containing protein|nr:putative RNA-binding protein RbpA [Chloroflexota bacterium]